MLHMNSKALGLRGHPGNVLQVISQSFAAAWRIEQCWAQVAEMSMKGTSFPDHRPNATSTNQDKHQESFTATVKVDLFFWVDVCPRSSIFRPSSPQTDCHTQAEDAGVKGDTPLSQKAYGREKLKRRKKEKERVSE